MPDKILFRFEIDSFSFSFNTTVIKSISHFVNSCGLNQLSTYDLYTSVLEYSEDGVLDKKGLEQWISKTVSSSAKNDDCEVIREFFRTYDRNAIQAVDAIDFIAGMSIFCHGRKSEKLAFVFDLMDDDKDSRLTKRGLWRYFRSFLAILITTSGAFYKIGFKAANEHLDDVSVSTASDVLRSLSILSNGGGGTKDINSVTFEEIADWYSRDGHSRATWLELLDLKKWLDIDNDNNTSSSSNSNNNYIEEKNNKEYNSKYDDDNDMNIDDVDISMNTDDSLEQLYETGLLQFDINLDDKNSLLIYEGDSDRILNVIKTCKIFQKDTTYVRKELDKFTNNNFITRESYLELFIDEVGEDDKNGEDALNVLDDIYTAFSEYYGESNIPFNILMTGLSILCRGSKSEKLELKLNDYIVLILRLLLF